MTVDSSGRLLVANEYAAADSVGNILIFKAGANGDVAPVGVIGGSNTGLNHPVDVKLDSSQRINVLEIFLQSVSTFAAGATGDFNVAPISTLIGFDVELNFPQAMTFNPSDTLYAANFGGATITEYDAGSSGDTPPANTISLENVFAEPAGIALDANNRIYVSDAATNSIFVYSASAADPLGGPPPYVTPVATISGSKTLLNGVSQIAVH
ncbi:MAG: hypothetical protein ACLQU2_11460 [Candidatus Binataceae bacterium]